MDRAFVDTEAVRSKCPLMIGLMAPSGAGKTYSALRLATGIQRVTGGDIYVIDTENGRAKHYADYFKFRHVPFAAPFGPLDYLAAFRHCSGQPGRKIIVADSMSHEHDGPGGVLEQHTVELQRLAGDDSKRMEKMDFAAWAKPKAARRKMINEILQMDGSFIFCFRAKDKKKPVKGEGLVELGFMPIAGEELIFEMTANALLLPQAEGVPTWQSNEKGEKLMLKKPRQFRELLAKREPLSEDLGEAMAHWAEGAFTGGPVYLELEALISSCADLHDLEKAKAKCRTEAKKLTRGEGYALKGVIETRAAQLAPVE